MAFSSFFFAAIRCKLLAFPLCFLLFSPSHSAFRMLLPILLLSILLCKHYITFSTTQRTCWLKVKVFILRILMNFYGTIRPCYITHRGETRVEFCRNDRWNHSKWSLLCCYVLSILCASNHVKHRALDSRYQSEKSLMMIYREALCAWISHFNFSMLKKTLSWILWY